MKRTWPMWVGAVLLVSGCAHTVHVPLNPSFQSGLSKTNALVSVRPPVTVGAGRYSDARPDTSKLAMFKQQMHTYNLYGDRPVSQVVFQGLHTLFTDAGHTWNDAADAPLRLDVQLLSVQASRNAGMIAVGAESAIQIKLDVMDARQNRVLYTQIYNGTDKRSQALVGFMGMVRASINQSILNCVNEVGKDEKLAAALTATNARP